MVTDHQVRLLMETLSRGKTLAAAAAKAGMSENTARKWRELGNLPSEVMEERTWRTREDPFCEVWDEVFEMLEINPGLQAKTIFRYLQRKSPGEFQDGQLRTFQRGVKVWRATAGPPREVFFPQVHSPGVLAESDFTCMNELEITMAGQPFDHVLYHFVLTYSNWEHATICFSENFQALSVGFQSALWELGGVPEKHRTDRLSTAMNDGALRRGMVMYYVVTLLYNRRETAVLIMPSRKFNQSTGEAKKAARKGPVFITERGSPAYVLLSIEEYRRITGKMPTIVDLLAMPGAGSIEFEPRPLSGELWRPADFS